MAVKKITFDGCSVSSKQDADINHFLGGSVPAGVLKGIGNECTVSTSNNYITFEDGYIQVYGRRVYVEAGSQVYISLDSSKYGYVVLDINMSTGLVQLTKVESSSTYPSLTQNDLSIGGTRYQFPIARYRKTTTSLTLDQSYKPTYIKSGLRKGDVTMNMISKSKMLEDLVNFDPVNEVTFDLDEIPFNVVVYISFTYVDTLGYGANSQLCGCFAIPKGDLYSYSYLEVRSTTQSGKTGTVKFIIDGTDYSTLRIAKADTSVYTYPNCVEISYYALNVED